RGWLERQRWYASKSRRVTSVSVAESIGLCDQPLLVLALLEAGFATGVHELYQVPVCLRPADHEAPREPGTEPGPDSEPVARIGSWGVYDALAEAEQAGRLLSLIDAGQELETDEGSLRFHRAGGALESAAGLPARVMAAEQSNTSVVFGD